MIVKCKRIIDSFGEDTGMEPSPWLKKEIEYVVLAIYCPENSLPNIYIQSENFHQPHFFSLKLFEVISQKIPSSWVTKISNINGMKSIEMLPKSWDYEDFFENVFEEEKDAILLFNKEVEKIYREEGLL